MNFLCIYLGEGRGGGALMHAYVWEHIVSVYYRTVYKTWQGWRSHGPAHALRCCGQIRPGGGGGGKIGHGVPLLQKTSSSDQKATETNQMDSNYLEACGKKCCYFRFHSEVKFLTCFWRLFGLSLHLFCVISIFLRGRMLISKI